MMELERLSNTDNSHYRKDRQGDTINGEPDWLNGSHGRSQEEPPLVDKSDHPTQNPDLYEGSRPVQKEPETSYSHSPEGEEKQHETAVYTNPEENQELSQDDPETEEQRQLEIEIQKLKEEGFLPMEDPPEYDIADRVRKLNEQLKAEGETAERTDRKVKFSEKVIAVEFPEELYEENAKTPTGDDTELNCDDLGDDDERRLEEATDPSELEVTKLTLEENSGDTEIESKDYKLPSNEKQTVKSKSPRGQDEKVLIERDGKFELISVKDMSPIERRFMGLEVLPDQDETNMTKCDPVTPNDHGDATVSSPPLQEAGAPLQPRPPTNPRLSEKPRPATANDSTGLRRSQLPPRRIQSARTQRDSSKVHQRSASYSGQSSYGMTPEEKQHKREQHQLRTQQLREQKQAEEDERRKKQEEAESAFQAWLQLKNEAGKETRQKEKEQTKTDKDKKDPNTKEENFNAWVKMKRDQAKQERKLQKHAEEEKANGYMVRERKECDQAFRQWLKSKREKLQKERLLKRSNTAYSRNLAVQSRKSKRLSEALETAKIYRFTDWYGYRF